LRLEGLGQLKNAMTSKGIEAATFRHCGISKGYFTFNVFVRGFCSYVGTLAENNAEILV
jgi:hypothetical protein